jgi:hypothetical protein
MMAMAEPEMVSNEEVERCFQGWDWRYRRHPERAGVWELSFQLSTTVFTVFVDNGASNPHFLSVALLYIRPQRNHREVYQQLLRSNGNVPFSKFVLDDQGNIWIRGAILRLRSTFAPEKLKHIIGSVLQAADHWYVELLTLATQG